MNPTFQKLLNSWPFLLGLVTGLCFMTLGATGFDLSMMPGDFGDGRFNNYILEHGHRFLTGQVSSYWNAPFMYPEKDVISYSDNLLGTLPLYSLWRFMGIGVETAFQLWYITISILNFWSAYLLLNWVFRNRYAAVAGAFVFAFSLALHSQLSHAQTFPRFFIPLAIWCLLLFRQELRPRYLFLALLMLVWQFYAGIYLGFMLAVPFGLLFLYILFSERKKLLTKIRQVSWVAWSLLSIAVNAVLLAILMLPYLERSKIVGGNNYLDIVNTIPTVRSFFASKSDSFFWDFLTENANLYPAYWDHQIFPGMVSILSLGALFAGLFFLRRKISLAGVSKTVWPLAAIGLVTFILFFRYNYLSAYRLLYALPGFSSMRSLTRIINIELLFFALAVAGVCFLLLRRFPRYQALLFCGFLTLLVLDNYVPGNKMYTTAKHDWQMRVDALAGKMKGIPEGSVVSYEPEDESVPAFFHQLDAMLATQRLNLISVNAYTATSPAAYNPYWWQPNTRNRNNWLQSMHADTLNVYAITESIGITPQ